MRLYKPLFAHYSPIGKGNKILNDLLRWLKLAAGTRILAAAFFVLQFFAL